jgi:sortase A
MGLVAVPEAPLTAGGRGLSTTRQPKTATGRPSPPAPAPPGVLAVIWVLASLSALAAWFLLYAFVLSGVQEARSQHQLYADLRSELALAIAPAGADIPLGSAVAILRAPRAGVNDVVLAGTTSGVLEQGPGLLRDSPLPGRAGVSVIYGRQALFHGPFRHLAALHRGDRLTVTTGQGTFSYVVQDLRYPGDPVPSPLPAGQGRLVLVTVVGAGWRGLWVPNQILYVDANLRGTPAASPGGQPTAVPANEMSMHGDTSVLMPLVLWLQLLLLSVVAVVWARSRWGGWQTWLVGAPAVLAVLWVVAQTAVQLLPNLL